MARLLTKEAIQELIENNSNTQKEVKRALLQDERAKFHTVPTQIDDRNEYLLIFNSWVGDIIDSSKLEVFKHLNTLPIQTVDFTESIFNQVKKVFHAEDRFITHRFVNEEMEEDFAKYLKEIGDNDFWSTKGFEAMKSSVSDILVIDMPSHETDGELPEPYYYLLGVENIIALDVDRFGSYEYLIFKDHKDNDIIHAWDGMFYRSYKKDTGTLKLLIESEHGVGYVPAISLWSTPYDSTSKIQKRGLITNALGRLDWLLYKITSVKHETLYAGFPVDIMYEQECSYEDDQGNVCDDGVVNSHTTKVVDGHEESFIKKSSCPLCSKTQRLGAGTQLTAPSRGDSDDPDLINGLNRVGADVPSLNWIEENITKDKHEITSNIIGVAKDGNDSAKNELQITSNYESRLTVLLDVKKNYERAHRFVVNTIGKLRYGSAYTGSIINYGERMFIYSLSSLNDTFKQFKENGMPVFELANQQNQIMHTKYQNNPEMIQRVNVLKNLEPYQTYTTSELLTMKDSLHPEKLALKLNFEEYINRFERENMNIVSFMQFSDMSDKVDVISAKLDEYVQDDMKKKSNQIITE